MYVYIFMLIGVLSIQETVASGGQQITTLEELFKERDAVKTLTELKNQQPEIAKKLCDEIMAPNFYQKAAAASVGVIKKSAMVTWCSGVIFERQVLKPTIQREKPAERPRESVVLKHVDFTKKNKGVGGELATLKAAQETILENAEKLGKKQEIQEKLLKAADDLEKAKEFYDNLSVAIAVMREDLKEIPDFKVFQPHRHDDDTPEEYLQALQTALARENKSILHKNSLEQVMQAASLLQQANENLAAGQRELENINREMMEMVK
jgi:hypothetical protein